MVKGERRIMHYSNKQMILLVGEGDFSFSSSLATAFGSAANIVATSYLSRSMVGINHWSSEAHLEFLERKGCLLLYGIDVYNMNKNKTLKYYSFDVIVFNFPHAGHFDYLCEWDSELIQMHKKLVEAYFRSASKMLNDGGEVHLTHRDDIPYNRWKVEKLAAKCGLHLKEKAPFCKQDYPGYHNKRGGGIESNKTFPIRSAFTFKFILKLSENSCQNDLDFPPTLRPKAAVDQIPNSQTKMHKTAQAGFSGGPSTSNDLLKPSPSLLADRNACLEAAVRAAVGTAVRTEVRNVVGTFNSEEELARRLVDLLPTHRPKAAVDQIPNSEIKMHKTAQALFSSSPSTNNDLLKPSPSLLAGRNAYLQATVRTANDKVSGTFNSEEELARGLADHLPTLRPKAAVDQIPNSQTKMHKPAQARFSDGPSTSNDLLKPSPSLLADRNAYASSKVSEDSESSSPGFDLKADFRTTNDKVSGTFNGVSKGVRDIPENLQSASSSVPTGRSLVTFGALLAVRIFLVFIAFTVCLPVMVLVVLVLLEYWFQILS